MTPDPVRALAEDLIGLLGFLTVHHMDPSVLIQASDRLREYADLLDRTRWQPIDAAVKDSGDDVLLVWIDLRPRDPQYRAPAAKPWYRIGFWNPSCDAWCLGQQVLHGEYSHPTYYLRLDALQPLPPPARVRATPGDVNDKSTHA